MPSARHIATYLGLLFLTVEAVPLAAQTEKEEEEIKLNEDVIKMIQFDFAPKENPYKPLNSSLDKKWMQFKEDLSMPRSMIDSTRVKKIKGYIRAEPYTIWTKFGENPVYDVMPTIEKKWTIQWKLNPFRQYRGEYGREIKPVPGETYLYVTSPAGPGASISLDFDKLLFESLTKRGRAIKHNRTHATAWKNMPVTSPPSKTMPALKNISQNKQRKRQLTAYSLAMTNPFFCTTIISIQTMIL